jgi:hypothetical protein
MNGIFMLFFNYFCGIFWFQGEMESKVESSEKACGNHGGICAICLDKIVLQETALVKGCEHAYWLV